MGYCAWLYMYVYCIGPFVNIDNFFIVADLYLRNLYQVDASSGAVAQLLPFGVASGPAGVAYDPTTRMIYWTDNHLHTINQYSLQTNTSIVIYRDLSNTGKHIGRVSYIRVCLCYFCFRWKTVSLVQASMQHMMHHVTVSLQQSKITSPNNCINNTSITQPTLSFYLWLKM